MRPARALATACLIAALALVLPIAGVTASDAGSDATLEEERFTSLANAEREARAIETVTTADDLVAVARAHARSMAERGELFHNPHLGEQVDNWERLGENVGRGVNPESVHDTLMQSPSHARVLLGSHYTEIGIGTYIAGDLVYVVQIFRQPAGDPAPGVTAEEAGVSAPADPVQPTPTRAAVPAPDEAEPAPSRPPVAVELAGFDTAAGATDLRGAAPIVAVDVPDDAVPTAAWLAAALLAGLVGAQGAAFRRLGLV